MARVTGYCDARRGRALVGEALRFDLHRRAHGNQRPDLVDLFVRDRDAAVGPIHLPVRCANPAVLGAKPVNLDVPAGTYADSVSVFSVARVGIRNMQRAMKLAGGLLLINHIEPFRRLVTPMRCLAPTGCPPSATL